MTDLLKSLPLSFRMIFKDPVNLFLAIIPTVLALSIYFLAIYTIFRNSDMVVVSLNDFIPSSQAAGWVGKLLTAIMVIFTFLLMSWTFVLVVGILAAPFNSMLSSRIERKLAGKAMTASTSQTFSEIASKLGQTFKNELKKLIFLIVIGILAFLLNLFPLFYPIGLFLVATLLAVQFVDYSWSRHDLHFGNCFKDLVSNIIPYSIAGFLFLILITVPIINAFVPALATSYFTVLWLHRQNKILIPPHATALPTK